MKYPHIVAMPALPERIKRDGTPSKARTALIYMRLSVHEFELVCFSSPRHRRKAGDCWHTEAFLERLKPWYRSRTVVRTPGAAREHTAELRAAGKLP